ncbi:MAG: complex I NDUFA9 subunit family protein [Proteobacteria bacterium]|nr:complex I NDUFA9 subunit family protein [Pseudomonadota bacterium]
MDWTRKKSVICVLGGTGFVGHRLLARLANQGHRLRVPTRYREDHKDLLVHPNLELTQCDIHRQETLDSLFEGCDSVINLVGILNEKGHDGSGFAQAHTELTRKVVDSCLQNHVPRLVYLSALNADGEQGASHYLRSKGKAEKIIRQSGRELAATILQPSVIFGEGDSFTNRFATLLRILPVFPLAAPRARMAPVYVEDVVSVLMRCLDDQALNGKTLQLCGPQVFSLKEIVQLIATSMQCRRLVVGLPDSLSSLQAAFFEYWPGKPFSRDNYRSLKVHSLCSENGFARTGISPHHFSRLIPGWLGPAMTRDKRDSARRIAGR